MSSRKTLAGETERLYTVHEVAQLVGGSVWAIRGRVDRGSCPTPKFHSRMPNGRVRLMWDQEGFEEWKRMYPEGIGVTPTEPYSDRAKMLPNPHPRNAVNVLDGKPVSWALWRSLGAERSLFWLSTPYGWFTSDTGRRWMNTGEMLRPDGEYRRHPMNTIPPSVRNSIAALRERLTSEAS